MRFGRSSYGVDCWTVLTVVGSTWPFLFTRILLFPFNDRVLTAEGLDISTRPSSVPVCCFLFSSTCGLFSETLSASPQLQVPLLCSSFSTLRSFRRYSLRTRCGYRRYAHCRRRTPRRGKQAYPALRDEWRRLFDRALRIEQSGNVRTHLGRTSSLVSARRWPPYVTSNRCSIIRFPICVHTYKETIVFSPVRVSRRRLRSSDFSLQGHRVTSECGIDDIATLL